jgi:hypothetical protein
MLYQSNSISICVCVCVCVHVHVLGAAIGCDDFQIGVLMNWIELRNKELTEYQ